jgi:hypothetical protein
VAYFALTLDSRPASEESILMMLDERQEAEEIAVELRRKGHRVTVRELASKSSRPTAVPPLR